jgi:formylglycine-generating enzyme required for sulfatase activity
MNCMEWFVAQAFCIWDGGRLPTEAEWNYAAAGGSEQRLYPWSVPPSDATVDPSHAVYQTNSRTPPVSPVGSRSPLGDGKWGQSDLAGNLWEFTRDQLDIQGPGLGYPSPCKDCISSVPVDTTRPGPGSNDAIRGGGFYNASTGVASSSRQNIGVLYPEADIGARCARAP